MDWGLETSFSNPQSKQLKSQIEILLNPNLLSLERQSSGN